ncbi:aminotransferase class V-fold PLP-dependent enzyme [Brooklawnia cerclae]|uniref:Isopenicillin-N epimerase n=1 Tax=Brooklawnia cerclae TaxID=349934 RepID=A0ABX0SH04_9ACTN|nr:isopenicillin-N epimerase [Brooklawnia cerclae]
MEDIPAPLRLLDGRLARDMWTLSEGVVHLNHGSFGAVPREVQEHQNRLRASMDADPVAWFATLPQRIGAAREHVADLLGVDRRALAFVPNATAGASAVFRSLPECPGGDVVVTDHGYGAVTYGAQRLAQRWGGRLVTAHVGLDADAGAAADAVVDALTPAARLLVVDHITSSTARSFPVREIAVRAAERGVLTLVDGAHVPGLYNDWVADGPWDYWVGNLHKFACAPRGTAVIVARDDRRDGLYPVVDSWGTPLPFPERFDWQGTLDLTSYLTAAHSWELLEQTWGWGVLLEYQRHLADYGERIIADAFAEATGEDHRVDVGQPVNAIRLIRLPSGMATDHDSADALRDRFVAETDAEAAFTSFGGRGYLRISVHAYNTAGDLEEFAGRYVPLLVRWAREEHR